MSRLHSSPSGLWFLRIDRVISCRFQIDVQIDNFLRNIPTHRLVQFTIRIGNKENKIGCSRPKDRTEGVIVDYTLDNGISWNVLEHLDPELFMDEAQVVQLELPSESKAGSSVIRWWQPLLLGSLSLFLSLSLSLSLCVCVSV